MDLDEEFERVERTLALAAWRARNRLGRFGGDGYVEALAEHFGQLGPDGLRFHRALFEEATEREAERLSRQ